MTSLRTSAWEASLGLDKVETGYNLSMELICTHQMIFKFTLVCLQLAFLLFEATLSLIF